jgi:hypothetical protein
MYVDERVGRERIYGGDHREEETTYICRQEHRVDEIYGGEGREEEKMLRRA